MKKKVILLCILALIFILPFATALNQSVESKARECIQNKVDDNGCLTFGLEDRLFTLLSIKECKNELLAEAVNNECFGLQGCTLKTTSQATLALSEAGSNTDDYVNWILSQNRTAQGIDWLIQIESIGSASCTLEDLDSNQYQVSVDENKKLTLSNTQNCLDDSTEYWLKIKPSCYDQEFSISCNEKFSTSLLFKKTNSQTLYVVDKTPETGSAEGTTFTEKISSLCFKQGTSCNYEGTLWATLVLKKLNYDVSSYFPYLIAFEEDNEDLLPESFLYYLTGGSDFLNDLILKQKGGRYWDEAGSRYYDTAVALLTISSENIEAKDNAMNWLASVQEGEGCWDSGSVASTGFLLYSLWPSSTTGSGGPSDDCEDAGYHCISDIECTEAEGDILSAYTGCDNFNEVCCTKDEIELTCLDLNGFLCEYNEECPIGFEEYGASDLETCCQIECEDTITPPIDDTCTPAGGNCRNLCETGEEENYNYDCEDLSDYCCIAKEKGGSLWWIWVLIILIILVVVAIKFKDKLKEFYLKLQIKKKPGPPTPPRKPGIPQVMPPRRPLRRILPSQGTPMRRPIPQRGKSQEIDEVLKKLKEMGK